MLQDFTPTWENWRKFHEHRVLGWASDKQKWEAVRAEGLGTDLLVAELGLA